MKLALHMKSPRSYALVVSLLVVGCAEEKPPGAVIRVSPMSSTPGAAAIEPVSDDLRIKLQLLDDSVAVGNSPRALLWAEQIIREYPQSEAAKGLTERLPELQSSNAAYLAEKAATELREREETRSKRAAFLSELHAERDDMESITKYGVPGSTALSTSQVGIYIVVPDVGDPLLRQRIVYKASDWLFVDGLMVRADGKNLGQMAFEYSDVRRDSTSSSVLEWVDSEMSISDWTMLETVANSKDATIRYLGANYYVDRRVSAREKLALRKVFKAFRALRTG